LVFYFKWSASGAIAFAIVLALALYFRLLRGSRALWLHINVKYEPNEGDG